MDPNDPNYDSDNNEESENAKKKNKTVKLNSLVPEMSEEDVRKAVEPLVSTNDLF